MEILEEVKDGKLTLEEMNNELDTKIYDYKLIKSLLMGNIEKEQRLLTRIIKLQMVVRFAKEGDIEQVKDAISDF